MPIKGTFADMYDNLPNSIRPIRIDEATHALITISYDHHELHDGNAYRAQYGVADIGALTTPDDMIQLTFTTPNTTKWLHMVFDAYCGAAATYKVTEAWTGGGESATGTITAYNQNRNSTNTPGIGTAGNTISYDATAVTGGTLLKNITIGAGSGPFAQQANDRGLQEIILKQNTAYAVSLFCTSNVPAWIALEWYEHTDKD